MRTIDLSHTIHDGLVTYPGLPAPVISDFLSREASEQRYEPGTTFHIGRIDMIANTGTYLDTPSHRYDDAPDTSLLELDSVADLDAVCIDVTRHGRAIDASAVTPEMLTAKAILFRTDWSRHFGSEAYGHGHPFLTARCAEKLVGAGVKLVGIDSLNIDDIASGARPVHSALLRAGILIVEHLTNLDQLPPTHFRFFAVPPKVRGMGTFPVRAFAMV